MSEVNSTIEYRTLPEYQGYKFGSDGSVFSCWTQIGNGPPKFGTHSVMAKTWTPLKTKAGKDGYVRISIRKTKGGIKRRIGVHQLVLLAFGFLKPSAKHEACHNNGISYDNRIANLRWDTRKGNSIDSVRHGTNYRGSQKKKLSTEEEGELFSLATIGLTIEELASHFKVSRSTIIRARKRRNDNNQSPSVA